MPAYVAGKAQAIYPGDRVALNSASLLTPFTTVSVAVGPNPDGSPIRLVIDNGSAVGTTVQHASVDTDASYQAYLDAGTAIAPAANKQVAFNGCVGFFRVLTASDPGATTISLMRG